MPHLMLESDMKLPEEIINRLQNAERVVVFTGAGVSAESGIPTFRDALTGLWENFDAEELASARGFKSDPALVWGWYEWRRMIVMRAQPNPAHLAIAKLASLVPQLTLVTQNVDDLHERAGCLDVHHLHGRINKPFCFACRRPYEYPPGMPDEPDGGRRLDPPRCSHCNGKIRPGVVWFGENLPDAEWKNAINETRSCDVFLCVGTSLLVQPAAQLPYLASKHGALSIQINPNPTPLNVKGGIDLNGAAGDVLPWLVELMANRKSR